MNSSIQQLFPQLVDDFNIIFSKLKGKIGFTGIDVIKTTDIESIRVIIDGLNTNETNEIVKQHKLILGDVISEKITWEEIPRVFKRKGKPPSPNLKKSEFFSTIQPGINIGDGFNQGTLGLICLDIHSKEPCILTAYHVVESEIVFQPYNPFREYIIGDFLRYDPSGDAALCSFVYDFANNRDFRGGMIAFDEKLIDSNVSIKSTRYPKLNEKLSKIGLVTNKTEAKVKGIGIYKHERVNTEVWIEGFWLLPNNPNNPNDDEISFEGDSGSIWFDEANQMGIGLLIAGDRNDTPPFQEFAIAQHLPQIIERLDIQLI